VKTSGSDVVIELEHRKGCWPVSVISGKYGLTCENVDSGGWVKSADFGLERISCGIPAEFRTLVLLLASRIRGRHWWECVRVFE